MNSIWDRYYADAEGLIFVVDASDPTRFPRVQDTLGEAAARVRRLAGYGRTVRRASAARLRRSRGAAAGPQSGAPAALPPQRPSSRTPRSRAYLSCYWATRRTRRAPFPPRRSGRRCCAACRGTRASASARQPAMRRPAPPPPAPSTARGTGGRLPRGRRRARSRPTADRLRLLLPPPRRAGARRATAASCAAPRCAVRASRTQSSGSSRPRRATTPRASTGGDAACTSARAHAAVATAGDGPAAMLRVQLTRRFCAAPAGQGAASASAAGLGDAAVPFHLFHRGPSPPTAHSLTQRRRVVLAAPP